MMKKMGKEAILINLLRDEDSHSCRRHRSNFVFLKRITALFMSFLMAFNSAVFLYPASLQGVMAAPLDGAEGGSGNFKIATPSQAGKNPYFKGPDRNSPNTDNEDLSAKENIAEKNKSETSTFYIDKGDVEIKDGRVKGAGEAGNQIYMAYNPLDEIVITISDSSKESQGKITAESSQAVIVLKDVNVKREGSFIDIKNSSLTLKIEGKNRIYTGRTDSALVHIPQESSLIIEGGGSLEMKNEGGGGALIGGNQNEKNGKVTVNGANLNLTTNGGGSCIGAGAGGSYFDININAGNIEAVTNAIGGGPCIGGSKSDTGTINIKGGTLNLHGGWASTNLGGQQSFDRSQGSFSDSGNIII